MEKLKNDISIKSERPAEPIKRKRTIRAKVLKRVADIFNFFLQRSYDLQWFKL